MVRAPKEFWSGLLFVAIGAAGVWLARDYPFGNALRMGPGYLPVILSWCTAVLGIVVFLRSFAIDGEPIGRSDWRPIVMVLAAIVGFGVLIGGVHLRDATVAGVPLPNLEIGGSGLVLSIICSAIIGGLGSRELGLWEMLVLSVTLAVFSALVFVVGLGQPMDLWPTWWPQGWHR